MRNEYPLNLLAPSEFEELVVSICHQILGIASSKFSTGPDGGRDSRFDGTATKFPSDAAPWNGVFIVQAKHTEKAEKSCSDNDFHGNKTSVIAKEIERLTKLKITDPFQNYIIFTNRSLPAGAFDSVTQDIKKSLSLSNVHLAGTEDINQWLTEHSEIPNRFGLQEYLFPLQFYEQDLKEIIISFKAQSKALSASAGQAIAQVNGSLNFVPKEEKNKLNNLSAEYFEFIKTESLSEFDKISKFLQDPINADFSEAYENTVSDLQAVVLLKREQYNQFEFLLEQLYNYVINGSDQTFKKNRRLVRVFLHFMYFNCDIGIKK